MNMIDLIYKKRKGDALNQNEIFWMIKQYTNNEIPDYQMSAFLMTVLWQGMNEEETAFLTDAMANSGNTINPEILGERSVDKHSSGGIGDKTTLIVAPIVASCGGTVAKMSGRGLGFTGGTIDKLESIPGYKTNLSENEFIKQVKDIGIAVSGTTMTLAPADKKLYALRDVTATVDSLPLIASSIMSKKIAAGCKSIVLDVKTGSGALVKDISEAEALAKAMVKTGQRCNRKIRALITDMDSPLGFTVGNALEVSEAIELLKGNGSQRLREICLHLSTNMLSLCLNIGENESRSLAENALDSGKAYEKMLNWISCQQGDIKYIENPSLLLTCKCVKELHSPTDGYIHRIDAEMIGRASMLLGCGREKKSDKIDHGAGIVLKYEKGSKISKNDVLAVVYSSEENKADTVCKYILDAFKIKEEAPSTTPTVLDIIK